MKLSFDPVTFDIAGGVMHWLVAMGILAAVSLFVTVIGSLFTVGLAGPADVLMHLIDAVGDLVGTSPRRCWAITQLTFREALRRKVWLVFALFALLYMFAGWFMSEVTIDTDMQAKNHVVFVLTTISWLILPVALLLACWGLPEDIKARSLHTVVTKPVRRHEVVIGRVCGYCGLCLFFLGTMSLVGWGWIKRQMPEEVMHVQLAARVPHYGELTFISTDGKPVSAAVNVGDENMFRSFIEGNTQARAVYKFSGISKGNYNTDNPLMIESSFEAFRTFKGNIEKQLRCQYIIVNSAQRNLRVPLLPFEINENRRNSYDVFEQNPKLRDKEGNPVEFDALLDDGTLTVEVACLSTSQFLGMARPDLFIRNPDRPFDSSYFKSVLAIGLMTTMVVVLGVVAGTFLKGPVATFMTLSIVVVGKTAYKFVDSLVTGNLHYNNPTVAFQGAGPFGATYRTLTHMTPGIPFEDKLGFRIINFLDSVVLAVMWAVSKLFPDLESFDTTEYTANGFDVPWAEALLPSFATTFAYCLPWLLLGYLSLRVRELEAK